MLNAVWFTEGCDYPPPHPFFEDSLFTAYIYKVSVIRLCRHQLVECMSLKAKQVQCKNKISVSCFTQEINTQNTTWMGRRRWQNNNTRFARSYKHAYIKNRLCQDCIFISIDIGLRFWTSPHHVRAYLLGDSGGVVNSLEFCPASLKSLGCFYFRCVLSSQWKAVTVNLRILHCQR